MSAAIELGKALRAEAEKVSHVRYELRDSSDESERDDRLYRDLDQSAELVRVLARIIEGKSIHEAFGSPGDFGYETPIGSALYRYYQKAQA
jgi:hypothetical protein